MRPSALARLGDERDACAQRARRGAPSAHAIDLDEPCRRAAGPEDRMRELRAPRARRAPPARRSRRRGPRTRRPGRPVRRGPRRAGRCAARQAAAASVDRPARPSGPSMPATRLASVSDAAGAVRTRRPSRRIVTVSARSRTSRRKCETSTTVVPDAARRRTISWSRSASAPESDAVGSSRTMSSASRASARRISTCCWRARGRPPTGTSAGRSKPVGVDEAPETRGEPRGDR